MERAGEQRGEGAPGRPLACMWAVLRRVRWGNVARLAALLAAGVLIALGGRDCGGERAEPGALRAPRVEPPAQTPTIAEPVPTKPRPTEPRRPARRRREERRKPVAPRRPRPRQEVVALPSPQSRAESAPSPAPPPPPRAGEFVP